MNKRHLLPGLVLACTLYFGPGLHFWQHSQSAAMGGPEKAGEPVETTLSGYLRSGLVRLIPALPGALLHQPYRPL